jgi:lipoyl(octanoyl) transferase
MAYPVPNRKVGFQHLGLMDYQAAWDYQTELFNAIVQHKLDNRRAEDAGLMPTPTANHLLFVEHPHVYTLGKSGKAEHLLLDEQGLQEKEATYYHINRGGDITYHGPGQLVGYPILDLDNFTTDIHVYLRNIEEAIILTLADYGIDAGRIDKLTGVWIDYERQENPRKICAIGVKTSRWVTMHGFAFNVNPDLSYFGNIVPCGISDKAVTSLAQELGFAPNMAEVSEKVLKYLSQIFEMEISHARH